MKPSHSHCFVAGQSGGHILPCITKAQEHLAKHPDNTILFFTTKATLDIQLTNSLDTRFILIRLPITSCTRTNPFHIITFLATCALSLCMALYYLIRYKPQSVTSTGGICTIPVACAAYCLRIPIDLFELNVLPGKTIYALAPIAHKIYHCFERTKDFLPKKLCEKAGYPVRFFNEEQHSRTTSHTAIGFDRNKKTILIIGGSQGSTYINTIIKQWIEHTACTSQIQIIHQTGSYDQTDWDAIYKQHNIPAITFPFNDSMEQFYAAADLVICRSGAGTLFEVLYFHTPCITIPLELHTNAHQIHNAFTMAQEYPELFHVLTQDMLLDTSTLEFNIANILELIPQEPKLYKNSNLHTSIKNV